MSQAGTTERSFATASRRPFLQRLCHVARASPSAAVADAVALRCFFLHPDAEYAGTGGLFAHFSAQVDDPHGVLIKRIDQIADLADVLPEPREVRVGSHARRARPLGPGDTFASLVCNPITQQPITLAPQRWTGKPTTYANTLPEPTRGIVPVGLVPGANGSTKPPEEPPAPVDGPW